MVFYAHKNHDLTPAGYLVGGWLTITSATSQRRFMVNHPDIFTMGFTAQALKAMGPQGPAVAY